MATGEPVGEPLTGHERGVYRVRFSPDGTRIVTSSEDKTARVWDAATGKPIGEPLKGSFEAFYPDGKRIVTFDENATRVWDAATSKPIGELDLDGPVAAFSPDGQRIVIASSDMTTRIWELENGRHTA